MNFKFLTIITLGLVGASLAKDLPDRESLALKKNSMRKDINGFLHLGIDGVLRSFSGNKTLLDSVPLSPGQISVLVETHPLDSEEQKMQLKVVFDGVDGRLVPHEHLRNPPAHVLPARNEDHTTAPVSRVRRAAVLEARGCYSAQCMTSSDCYYIRGCSECILRGAFSGSCQ